MEWDAESERELQQFKVMAKAYSMHLETMIGFKPENTDEGLLMPMVEAGISTIWATIGKVGMDPIDAMSFIGVRCESMNVAWKDMVKRHSSRDAEAFASHLMHYFPDEHTHWRMVREALPFLCDIDITSIELAQDDIEFLDKLKGKLDTVKKAGKAHWN